jgi:hypothetical protein
MHPRGPRDVFQFLFGGDFMGDGFLANAIRRNGRNCVLLGLGGFAFVAVLFCAEARYLHNFFHGPFPMSQATLLATHEPGTLNDSFVTIQTDKTADTRFEESSTDYFITTHHPILMAKIGDRILLVKVSKDTKGPQFSGELTDIPSDVRAQVLQVLEQRYPTLKGQFLPLLLDATGYRFNGYFAIPAGILFGLGFIWFAGRGVRWMCRPETHPIWKMLAKYGPAKLIGSQVDAEFRSEGGGETFGNAHLTTTWLVHSHAYNMEIVRMADVVWAYLQVVKHYHSGIPTGKSHFVKVFDREGTTATISTKKKTAPELLQTLQRRVPWAVYGFSADIEQLWKKRRAEFCSSVDQRRGKTQTTSGVMTPAGDKKDLVPV